MLKKRKGIEFLLQISPASTVKISLFSPFHGDSLKRIWCMVIFVNQPFHLGRIRSINGHPTTFLCVYQTFAEKRGGIFERHIKQGEKRTAGTSPAVVK
jgi:hypothetical protein